MSPNDKHVAVLVEEAYQEMEVWYPVYRLREAGVRVTIVGTGTREVYPSKCGYPCRAQARIDEVLPGDFDGVIVPGGWAPDFLRRHEAVNALVADLDRAGKIVAAICHGGWVLCSADILKGRRATSFFAIKHDLMHAGAQWVDEETVVDGNLITARTPDDLPAFMKAVLKGLQS
jgi:protease I